MPFDPARLPRPADAGKAFLIACLAVSALYTGLVLRDWEAARNLVLGAAGVAGVAGFTKLDRGQKAIDARVADAGAKVDELHKTVNSTMAAKDARTDSATASAADAAKLSADTATDAAKSSADSEALMAADRVKALTARNAELERRLRELGG